MTNALMAEKLREIAQSLSPIPEPKKEWVAKPYYVDKTALWHPKGYVYLFTTKDAPSARIYELATHLNKTNYDPQNVLL